MKIYNKLNKVIAHFEGGFGWAHLNSEGEQWEYQVKSCTFNDEGMLVLVGGKHKAPPFLVKEHGHEEMFRRAINKIPA